MRLTLVGHATVLIELDGMRILTDPLLRDRTTFLRTQRRTLDPAWTQQLDAILLSHMHRDHYDPPSLRQLDPATLVVGPPGTARRLRRHGRLNVAELRPGESTALNGVLIRATKAAHGRTPARFRLITLGFLVTGSGRLYFAGDTDLFPELAELASQRLDVALVPIGGWGPRLGAGHLDPRRAAEAIRLIEPRVAIPIHWGFLRPLGLGRFSPHYLTEPGMAFARLCAEVSPQVNVRLLEPGQSLEVTLSSELDCSR
jgi:L-ascorbate metabolism protein UlaG (beta-lactamase superfamily)